MAHKVILPPKKNYIPQFLKQRDINSYSRPQTASLVSKHRQNATFPSAHPLDYSFLFLCGRYTDKKENQIFLIYQEMQEMGPIAKLYMTIGLLING